MRAKVRNKGISEIRANMNFLCVFFGKAELTKHSPLLLRIPVTYVALLAIMLRAGSSSSIKAAVRSVKRQNLVSVAPYSVLSSIKNIFSRDPDVKESRSSADSSNVLGGPSLIKQRPEHPVFWPEGTPSKDDRLIQRVKAVKKTSPRRLKSRPRPSSRGNVTSDATRLRSKHLIMNKAVEANLQGKPTPVLNDDARKQSDLSSKPSQPLSEADSGPNKARSDSGRVPIQDKLRKLFEIENRFWACLEPEKEKFYRIYDELHRVIHYRILKCSPSTKKVILMESKLMDISRQTGYSYRLYLEVHHRVQKRRREAEQAELLEMWGRNRLAPQPADKLWSAAPSDTPSTSPRISSSSKFLSLEESGSWKSAAPSRAPPTGSIDPFEHPFFDSITQEETDAAKLATPPEQVVQILHGEFAVSGSSLKSRDNRGHVLPVFVEPSSVEDPFVKDIRGSLAATQTTVEKIAPLRKMEVATLAHGLDRVLFNPGVHWLRDPRSGIYNFDPRLRNILDVDLFDYAALPPYITSSKDADLAKLTKVYGNRYCGSTSSMTAVLSQCYFLISAWRNPDTSGFSAPFAEMSGGYSIGAKLPASILLHWKDGHYAIDADKSVSGGAENDNYVLTSLGKSLEKMLTSKPEEYAKYTRVNSHELTEEERNKPEAYHYASTGKMMMRSQLDCHDDRLPRKTFDLKTRACIGIRHDRANYVEGSGYQIRRATGVLESFEREYFDMIRAAFLKYCFQARIGHMDGIMVAYHTTSTIFGFQYIPVEEMNERLFGSQEMADQAFKLSLGMMEKALDAATSLFPEQTLRITLDGKEKDNNLLSIFVEPAEPHVSDVTPATTGEAPAQTTTTTPPPPPKRKIAQLDVTVDRYLDGKLVRGPVDFTLLPGRKIDWSTDDEIERRLRQTLPEVRWEVDYQFSPRPDLTEEEIFANLQMVRNKQASMSTLILPNVEALNEREQYRLRTLAENPAALQRFLQERASGVAAGMPLAPGQASSDTLSSTKMDAAGKAPADPLDLLSGTTPQAGAISKQRLDAATRFIRMRNSRLLRLRALAKLGAKDAKLDLTTDRQILYQSQS